MDNHYRRIFIDSYVMQTLTNPFAVLVFNQLNVYILLFFVKAVNNVFRLELI